MPLLCLAMAGQATADAGPEILTGTADRTAVAVTIYNDNLALVRDQRKVALAQGSNRVAFRDVSAQIRPETASLRSLSGGDIDLVEQNFDFDLLSPQKLLEKHLGRQVTVITVNPQTNGETREKATVLATNNGVVFRYADRIESGYGGRLAFEAVPANLRDRPTLSVLLNSAAAGSQELELSYLTGGLTWKADYIANLSQDGKRMALNGWVTLTNASGTRYDNAQLQLVAGTLNRARPEGVAMPMMAPVAKAARAMEMKEEGLFEYHLYTLERKTTLLDNQTKQVALLSAESISVRREYLLQGAEYYYGGRHADLGKKLKPAVFLEFDNKGGQLGKPLPKGVVRAYLKDSAGRAQFVGEDWIPHTARNEKVRLKLGEAFDVTADRVQTSFSKLSDKLYESSYRIDLRNAKDEAVTVKVLEPLPGDWEITQSSRPHRKESSRIAAWDVEVPASGSTRLEYTARVKY
jgi:hypothetical protein